MIAKQNCERKIGLLGGTFDPIHNGHLAVAEAAMTELGLDGIVFMVSGTPAYKTNSRRVTPSALRLKMTSLSVSSLQGYEVSDIECRREGNTYTYETLRALREAEPDCTWVLILGADAFYHTVHWVEIASVVKDAVIAVVSRADASSVPVNGEKESLSSVPVNGEKESLSSVPVNGEKESPFSVLNEIRRRSSTEAERIRNTETYLKETYGARVEIFSMEPVPVSSTMIRERVQKGESIHGLLPEEAEAFILSQGLYQIQP